MLLLLLLLQEQLLELALSVSELARIRRGRSLSCLQGGLLLPRLPMLAFAILGQVEVAWRVDAGLWTDFGLLGSKSKEGEVGV